MAEREPFGPSPRLEHPNEQNQQQDVLLDVLIAVGDLGGQQIGEATVNVLANTAQAFFVDELVTIPTDHTGQVLIRPSDNPGPSVYVVGLRVTGLVITTIPAIVYPRPTTSPSNDPWSRPNIERFRGTWRFTYTRSGAAITDTFVLNIVLEDDDTPGEWFIGGVQDDGAIAVLIYNQNLDSYLLFSDDPDAGVYTLNLTSPTTVSGCYREKLAGNQVSSCLYPMTGVKTSSSTQSLLKRAQPNTTAAQSELDLKIIRVLEDLGEVLRQ